MKIEKDKRKVSIICADGTSIKGVVFINNGERVSDFINDANEQFIAVTSVEFYYLEDVQSFKLASKMIARRDCIILNKRTIKWIEELK